MTGRGLRNYQCPGPIWQRIKNIGLVTGLGGLFATKVCHRRGCSATNPLRDKPLEDYSTLQRGPRQGFVTERDKGLQQRRGARDNTGFDPQPYLLMQLHSIRYSN